MDKISKLQQEIIDYTEYLSTTEGDEIACIGIENLQGILEEFFNQNINIIEDDI